MNKPKLLGITDECTTCDCCGKTNLKKTLVLNFGGVIRNYGSTCGTIALMPRSGATPATRKGIEDRAIVTQQVQKDLMERNERGYTVNRNGYHFSQGTHFARMKATSPFSSNSVYAIEIVNWNRGKPKVVETIDILEFRLAKREQQQSVVSWWVD